MLLAAASVPGLTARGLTKRYGRRPPALQNVDVTIPAGGVTALVGPNGAGKSTLLRSWVGFERPTSGNLEVLGIDPWRDRRSALRQLGYVAQRPSLYRELSAWEHLQLAGGIRLAFDLGFARAQLVELEVPLHVRTDSLSGGQAAQVALAIALGTRAPVILLDEPLASLDPLARQDFLRILTTVARQDGLTVVLSSHIVGELDQVANRVLVLGKGQVLYEGTVAEAQVEHAVVAGGAPTLPRVARDGLVSEMTDANGEISCLVRTRSAPTGDGRSVRLEEIVLGYLAADRRARSERDGGVT